MIASSRRSFVTAATALSLGRVLSANERIGIGIVGIGGRGNDHIDAYAADPDARIAGLCDIDQAAVETGVARVRALTGTAPRGYGDMREMFADKDIDAVSIATPNHWHALATIWACEAGKDVYCEKPACYNVHEGERMIETAGRTASADRVAEPERSAQGARHAVGARRGNRENLSRQRTVLQAAPVHRPPAGSAGAAARCELGSLPRAAPLRSFNALRFKKVRISSRVIPKAIRFLR